MQVRETQTPATGISAPTDTDPERFAIVKSKLDLAWGKIQDALQQEAEGHKLWIEGTLSSLTCGFAPKATDLLRCLELTRCANRQHFASERGGTGPHHVTRRPTLPLRVMRCSPLTDSK